MHDTKPWRQINTDRIEDAHVCVMGIAFDNAATIGKGAALGPESIRNRSRLIPAFTEEGYNFEHLRVYDVGDLETDLNWERFFGTVEKEAGALLSTEKFCLFLGGDHSISIPLHNAFAKQYKGKKIGIIHFDSHPDILDEYEGHKWAHACTEKRAVDNHINPEDLALVGIRAFEPEEVVYINENPVLLINAVDIFKEGYMAACEKLKAHFKDYDALYFTLDIDVLDPAAAPGTGTPEAGGLTNRELLEMVKYIYDNLPVKAMDIVEVSPPLDTANQITSWAALKIIYEVFGRLAKAI